MRRRRAPARPNRPCADASSRQAVPGERRLASRRLDEALFDAQHVAPCGGHRQLGQRGAAELGQHAGLAQQQQLERAQRRFAAHLVVAQGGQRGGIGVEQARVRVVARQQPQQQLVEVEAGEPARPAQGSDLAAAPFGAAQRAHLGAGLGRASAQTARCTAWNGISTAAQLRGRPLGALGRRDHAAGVAGEQLDDQARLAPVVAVQHEGVVRGGGRRRAPLPLEARAAAAPAAGFELTRPGAHSMP